MDLAVEQAFQRIAQRLRVRRLFPVAALVGVIDPGQRVGHARAGHADSAVLYLQPEFSASFVLGGARERSGRLFAGQKLCSSVPRPLPKAVRHDRVGDESTAVEDPWYKV